ncbi:MAG: hypothetical protein WC967_02930 [Balneolaceae bacterium]
MTPLKRYIYITTFVLSSVFCPNLKAQESLDDFILTAFEDLNLQQYESQIQFLTKRTYSLPLIDKLEARFDNDDLTKDDQEYALRLKPNNPWKVRRNNALFNASKLELQAEKKILLNENLYWRYELALGYLIEQEAQATANAKLDIINQMATILSENQQSVLFDPKSYVGIKLKQIDALSTIGEIKQASNFYTQHITTILHTTQFNWDNVELISVENVEAHALDIIKNQLSSSEALLLASQIEVAKKEIRLENSNFDIGFIQTKYQPYSTNKSNFGVSFGINIPLFKSNKNKIAEGKMAEIALSNELVSTQHSDSLNRAVNYQYLLQLIEQHKMLEEQIDLLDLDSITKNLSLIQDNNPISYLELKEGILKLDELRFKSKKAVLEQYLEFLVAFDALAAQPLINHLSNHLEPLK